MPERKPRKDAARNRAAILAAADTLFARLGSPEDVTMADIAAAAGVGKGTLFRAFDDRPGLLRALYEARLEPMREAVEAGPPPLGPATPPAARTRTARRRPVFQTRQPPPRAGAGGKRRAAARTRRNITSDGTAPPSRPGQVPGLTDSDFTAHALLAATRADLVEHLAGQDAFRGTAGGTVRELRHQSPGLRRPARVDRRGVIEVQRVLGGHWAARKRSSARVLRDPPTMTTFRSPFTGVLLKTRTAVSSRVDRQLLLYQRWLSPQHSPPSRDQNTSNSSGTSPAWHQMRRLWARRRRDRWDAPRPTRPSRKSPRPAPSCPARHRSRASGHAKAS